MPGTLTTADKVVEVFRGYSSAAVTANLYLAETVILYQASIGAVKVYAETAGTGGGNTVVGLLKNGTSVWTTAGNRPTLAATSTGEFASVAPNDRALKPGDRLALQVISISATGHARLFAAVSLEKP